MMRLVASQNVEMKGVLNTAGSARMTRARIGMTPPTVAASVQMPKSVSPMTRPRRGSEDDAREHEAEDPEQPAEDRPDADLAPGHEERVARRHLSEGERAGHRRRGLCAGVAGRAGEERDEEGERDDLLERRLEDVEHADGEQRRDGEHEQPHDARPDDPEDGRREVGTAQGLGGALTCGILVGRILEDPRRVVDREDADEPVLAVHDRRGQQLRVDDRARRFLRVIGRVHVPRVGHEVADERIGGRHDELAQSDDTEDRAVRVRHGQRVDGLGVAPAVTHVRQSIADRELRLQAHELRAHETTDAPARVAEHRGCQLALTGRQSAHELLRDACRKLVHELRAVIGVELLEDAGDVLVAEPAEQLRTHARVE